MNNISKQAALTLHDKLISSPVPLGVFVTYGGSWTATKVNTDSFKDQSRRNGDRLMGVYTIDAKLADLAEDFYNQGVK